MCTGSSGGMNGGRERCARASDRTPPTNPVCARARAPSPPLENRGWNDVGCRYGSSAARIHTGTCTRNTQARSSHVYTLLRSARAIE